MRLTVLLNLIHFLEPCAAGLSVVSVVSVAGKSDLREFSIYFHSWLVDPCKLIDNLQSTRLQGRTSRPLLRVPSIRTPPPTCVERIRQEIPPHRSARQPVVVEHPDQPEHPSTCPPAFIHLGPLHYAAQRSAGGAHRISVQYTAKTVVNCRSRTGQP